MSASLGRWTLAVLCAVLAAPAVVRAQAAEPLPVEYSSAAFIAGSAMPDRVPGANDLACVPTAEHPRPVVLVHGTLLSAGSNWATFGPLLHNEGFCVFARTFGRPAGEPAVGGITSMRRSARKLQQFVERVLDATGAPAVDLVTHSSGTIMSRWYLRVLGGATDVRRVVQLAPFWRGAKTSTDPDSIRPLVGDRAEAIMARLKRGAGAQMSIGSPFLRRINAAPGPAVRGVQFTSIVTRNDTTVPFRAGLLDAPNVTNLIVQDVCPEDQADHIALAFDPLAAQATLNALAPDRAMPLPCAPMTAEGSPNPPAVGLRRR